MRVLLPSVVAALLALVLVVVWRVVASDPAAPAIEVDQRFAGEPSPGASGPADRLAPGPDADASARDAGSVEGERAAGGPATRLLVRVVVVDGGTGARLPGVPVRAAAERVLRFLRPAGVSRDAETDLDRESASATTDADGEVELDLELPAIVDARSGDAWGWARIDESSESPARIELAPDRSVIVQTVGADGAPLPGVPIALAVGELESRSEPWRGLTEGEEALARVPHVDRVLSQAQDARASIRLRLPTRRVVAVSFDKATLPSETVRLEVPPTGSLVLRVEDPRGAVVERAELRLAPAAEDQPGFEQAHPGIAHMVWHEGGEARLPHVEIGAEWSVTASSDEGWKPVTKVIPGPRASGETVEHVLRFEESHPLLVGLVVDEHGAPLARHALRPIFRARASPGTEGRPSRPHPRVVTGEDGRFRIVVGELAASSPPHDEIVLDVLDARSLPVTRVVAPLPSPLVEGENDLGTIRASPLPVLVAGRVVGEDGQALAGAQVDLQPADTRAFGFEHFGAASDDEGRFEVRGAAETRSFTLNAVDVGFVRFQAQVEAGARGLEIVLRRACELSGRVLLEEGTPPESFLVQAEVSSTPQAFAVALDPAGRFRLRGLPVGFARVTLRHIQAQRELVTFDEVPVDPGASWSDPRLDPIDLRGRVRLLAIDVVDAAGNPVEPGHVLAREIEGPGFEARYELRSGRARVLWSGRDLVLKVAGLGLRTETVSPVATDQRVLLRGPLPVRLRLAAGVELPQAPVELVLELVLDPASGAPAGAPPSLLSTSVAVPLGAQGEALARLIAPGSWRVRLSARSKSGGFAMIPCEPKRIEVADQAEEQPFELAPDRAVYEKLLREME